MKRIKNDTLKAKIDIVSYPDNIKNYRTDRKDYTELAHTAIQNKPSVIEYIPYSYKDYSLLCEEAIKEDLETLELIDYRANNYKELCIMAININPYAVVLINKKSIDYVYLWKLAIQNNYEVIDNIEKDDIILFPLLLELINKEPLAIKNVNSNISIYNKLCNIAYNINSNSIYNMSINDIDKELVFALLKRIPRYILYLDNKKEFYYEACKLVLRIDGKLIEHLYPFDKEENLEEYFELISIAANNSPEIEDYPCIIEAFCLYNRKMKERIMSTPNILGDNLYKLLSELDSQYNSLLEDYNLAREKIVEKDSTTLIKK